MFIHLKYICYREINIFINIKILLFNKISSFYQQYQNIIFNNC